MSKLNNISEEIKRIKSLFNDDRLYGNLINEATPAEITAAINLLKSNDYKVLKMDGDKSTKKANCNNPSDNLDCIADILDTKNIKFAQFDQEGKCVITVDGYWKKPGQPEKDRRVTFYFVNDDNEFAYSIEDKNIVNSFSGTSNEVLPGNEFEIRGEWLCDSGEIYWEGNVDRFKKRGDSWVNKKSKNYKVKIDFSRLKQT